MNDENNEYNPFLELSNLFVDNQRVLNKKTEDLSARVKTLSNKLQILSSQLERNVFTTDLVTILTIEDESRLILSVAKELEFQRDQITTSIKMLTKSREIKLNK